MKIEKDGQFLVKESGNLERYEKLISCVKERYQAITAFERFLRNSTDWLTAPASTRFHCPFKGGLITHSLNVAETLLSLRESLAPDISAESCVITGLYHDAGKVGIPGKPYYILNTNEWEKKNRRIFYTINQDLVYLDLPTRSLCLIMPYIPLTEEEIQAIRYHDGQYIDENRSSAHRESKLTRLLQYADNWCGGVIEEKHS
ncbi:MAG: HD domain-containing protein [Vulcanimicrobiota bacterium]